MKIMFQTLGALLRRLTLQVFPKTIFLNGVLNLCMNVWFGPYKFINLHQTKSASLHLAMQNNDVCYLGHHKVQNYLHLSSWNLSYLLAWNRKASSEKDKSQNEAEEYNDNVLCYGFESLRPCNYCSAVLEYQCIPLQCSFCY